MRYDHYTPITRIDDVYRPTFEEQDMLWAGRRVEAIASIRNRLQGTYNTTIPALISVVRAYLGGWWEPVRMGDALFPLLELHAAILSGDGLAYDKHVQDLRLYTDGMGAVLVRDDLEQWGWLKMVHPYAQHGILWEPHLHGIYPPKYILRNLTNQQMMVGGVVLDTLREHEMPYTDALPTIELKDDTGIWRTVTGPEDFR